MRTHNAGQGVFSNREYDMAVFDTMSKANRDLLNSIPQPFNCESIALTFWRYDAEEMTPMVEATVLQKCRQLMRETWGRDYPVDLPLTGWERPPGPKSRRMHRGRRLTRIR